MSILNVVHNVHPALQADDLQIAQEIRTTDFTILLMCVNWKSIAN